MKLSRLLILIVPLLLSACGLSDQQKADYARVQQSGVSSAVYDKMVHGDDLSLYDIKSLSRAHVSDGIILRYDVAGLRKAGVSQSIVDYMLQTPQNYATYGYPYAYPYPYPYWGGPAWGPYWGGGFWYGGGYHHHWH